MSDQRTSSTADAEQLVPTFNYRGLSLHSSIPSSAVSVADLRKLYRELSEKTAEALERQLGSFQRPADMTVEEFDVLKQRAREIGTLTVIVEGARGEHLLSSTGEVLEDDKLPEELTFITFDSAAAIKTQNVTPLNRFKLTLDFTEPPGFNVYNPWDQPTPNNSKLEVLGPDHTWVTAVHEATLGFFERRKRRRGWLHAFTTFNVLNWLLGFPGALWIVYRIDERFGTGMTMHTALRGALYIYVFLLALFIFRAIVFGFRWLYPVIELEGSRSTQVRIPIGAVLGSLLLALVYDVLKTLFA